MWSLTESVNGSNAVAPVDAYAPKTAASLEGMYRETSPAREIITCDAMGLTTKRPVSPGPLRRCT